MDWLRDLADFLASRDLLRTFSHFWFQIGLVALIGLAIVNRWRIVLLVLILLISAVAFVYLTAGGPVVGVERQTLFFIGGCLAVMFVAIYLLYVRK